MCGVAGVVRLEGLTAADPPAVANMVRAIRHRGPDDEGSFHDGNAALGHARLSIIDLSACGRQPLANEDETIWITFNGEIYNFAELRDRLAAKGHRFRTKTDTEVIVHLYEEEGERCVELLRGMFAFAIWDRPRRRLFLARDRLGIKPLYYGLDGGRFAFASEIKSLLQLDAWPRDVDPEAIQDFLTFGWIPAPKSIFRSVRKLPPAHTATFDDAGFRVRRYWDFDDTDPFDAPEPELCERLKAGIEEAVRLRLVADVPVGAFLSGGLDSSSVVATMAGLRGEPVVTNSIGFDDRRFDESDHAAQVARRFGTDHHHRVVTPNPDEILPILTHHWDEPFADSSAIPTYYVSRMARDQVTVALSGDGGDENLAGYRRYKFSQRVRALRDLIPGAVRRRVLRPAGHAYPKADWLPRPLRAKSALLELAGSDVEAIYRSRAIVQPEVTTRLIGGDLRRSLGGYDSMSVIEEAYRGSPMRDPLNRELYVDIKTYLADDILAKVDRASMAVGLEVRVPLLDHKLVELMSRIPSRYKLRGGEGKYLLKQTFRPLLGPEIVDRPKMGFSVPLNKWLRGPLRSVFEDNLFAQDARSQEWLDYADLRQRWASLQNGTARNEALLWAVLCLELWARTFRDAGVRTERAAAVMV